MSLQADQAKLAADYAKLAADLTAATDASSVAALHADLAQITADLVQVSADVDALIPPPPPPPPAPPTISSFSPVLGNTTGGPTVTIIGTNFTNGTSVTFGGAPSGFVALISSTIVSATVPPGVAGPCPIVVTTPAGSSAPMSGFAYQVPVPTPPPTGPSADGTVITPTTGGSIRDEQNHIWSLGGGNGPNQLMMDGAPSHDPGGSLPAVSILTILAGNPWYQASNGQWWKIDNGNYQQQSSGPVVVVTPPPPPPPQNGSPPAPSGTVAFVANPAGNYMDASFVGLSIEKPAMCVKNLWDAANTKLIALVKLLSPRICLRVGANEFCRYNSASTAPNYNLVDISEIAPSDIDRLAAFIVAVDGLLIYDVPIQGDSYNPSNEAAEIAYLVSKLPARNLLAVQFGNEPDLVGAFNEDYAVKWQDLWSSVSAVAPNVKFAGPATAVPSCLDNNPPAENNSWVSGFSARFKDKLTFLTKHYYPWLSGMGGQVIADPRRKNLAVWSPDGFLDTVLSSTMQAIVARDNIASGWHAEECGSINQGGQDGYSNGYPDAMWPIDFCFQVARYGCRGINHHGGGNNPYSWFDFDFGPGGHNSVGSGALEWIKPTFYGMLVVAQMLPGKLMDVASGAPSTVRSYGIANDDGSYSAVLINTDTSPVTLTLQMSAALTTATSMVLTNPAGFDAVGSNGVPLNVYQTGPAPSGGTTFGGASVQLDGTWNPTSTPLAPSGSSVTVTVPAQSAVVVKAI